MYFSQFLHFYVRIFETIKDIDYILLQSFIGPIFKFVGGEDEAIGCWITDGFYINHLSWTIKESNL